MEGDGPRREQAPRRPARVAAAAQAPIRGRLLVAIALALPAGVFLAVWSGWHAWVIERLQAGLTSPSGPNQSGLQAMAVGAAVTVVLMAANLRFPGLPLHPIGFPVAFAWRVDAILPGLVLAWTVKTLLLRYGGLPAHRRALPPVPRRHRGKRRDAGHYPGCPQPDGCGGSGGAEGRRDALTSVLRGTAPPARGRRRRPPRGAAGREAGTRTAGPRSGRGFRG